MNAQAASTSVTLKSSVRTEAGAWVPCARSRRLHRLLRDETAVTSLEYVVAALAIVLGAVASSRVIAGALVGYLHRIYMVVTLPIP